MITQSVTTRRRRRLPVPVIAVGAAVILCALVVGALAGWAWLERDTMPSGTTIDGVDVSGLSRDDAERVLQRRATTLAAEPIRITAGSAAATITGESLDATPLVDDALDEALDVSFTGRMLARAGLRDPDPIELDFVVGSAKFKRLADAIDGDLGRPAQDATVVVRSTTVVVTPATRGTGVNRPQLRRALRDLPEPVTARLRASAPTVSTVEAERARATIEALLERPRTVALRTTAVVLRPRVLGSLVRTEPDGRMLVVSLDTEGLVRRLRPRFRKLETAARDATWRVDGTRARIVPSRPGKELDAERIAASLTSNLSSSVHRARFTAVQPELTTEDAKALRITHRVSQFTTYYPCCAPRVTNIQRAATLLDGLVLEPRGEFSMNEILGKRTEENGFVSAPQIFAGRLEDAVGGGISQVATTLYNAAFFAGLRLDAHQPHQFYISRYPMGREATVSWGGPELIFTNDWAAGLLLKVRADATSITVSMYSSKLGRKVTTMTGEPYSFIAPVTRRVNNASLPPGTTSVVQDAGASGFTVDYTRKVFRGAKVKRNERFRVRYDAQNAIVEVGPPKPAKPAKPKPDPEPSDPGTEPPPADSGTEPPPADS